MPIRPVLILSLVFFQVWLNAIRVKIANNESSDQSAPLEAVSSGLHCLPVPYVRYEVVTILEDSISR